MLKCGLTKSSSERGVNKFVHHSVTFSSSIYTMAPLEHAIKWRAENSHAGALAGASAV